MADILIGQKVRFLGESENTAGWRDRPATGEVGVVENVVPSDPNRLFVRFEGHNPPYSPEAQVMASIFGMPLDWWPIFASDVEVVDE